MGQAPTRPSQQDLSISQYFNSQQDSDMDLPHLRDLSPFKRSSKAAISVPADPPVYQSTPINGGSASRLSSEGRKVRKRDGGEKSRSRRAERERANLSDVKDRKIDAGRRKRRTINKGSYQLSAERSSSRLAAVPRIDIVESSPLLGAGQAKETSNSLGSGSSAAFPAQTPPAFPRSPSMPAVLQESAPSYSLPLAIGRPVLERPISSPHLSLSCSGLAPQLGMLPLPGTPISDLILAERPQQDFLEAFVLPDSASKPVMSAQAGSLPASRSASFFHADDCDSVGSVITQQIKILRVTNPDIDEEENARAGNSGEQNAVDTASKRTLAEKRKVSAPPALMTPMKPQKASLLSPRSANRLSPSSATSSSYINSSSDLLSPSTAATSLSPTSPSGKSHKTSLYPTRAAPPVPEPVTPAPVRSFLISRPAKKLSADYTKPKAEDNARVGEQSGDSSNADESEECSTVSAMSEEEAPKARSRKHKQDGKAKKGKDTVTIGKRQLLAAKPKRPGLTKERQERRVSAPLPPAGQLLDITDCFNAQPDWRRVSLAAPGYTPTPVSPRPPATPFVSNAQLFSGEPFARLPEPGTPVLMPHEDLEVHAAPQEQNTYFLPAPPSLQMDGFTSELLSRCGVDIDAPQVHTSSPQRSSKISLGPHPSILRPTSSRLTSERRIVSLPIDYISAPPRELLVEAGAVIEKASSPKAGPQLSASAVRHERAARRAEKAARYEAFRQLALMAVDSPLGNPYVELSTGAVRLGEYKRGFDESEIERWAQRVQQAVREEEQPGDRASRRVKKEYV